MSPSPSVSRTYLILAFLASAGTKPLANIGAADTKARLIHDETNDCLEKNQCTGELNPLWEGPEGFVSNYEPKSPMEAFVQNFGDYTDVVVFIGRHDE